MGSQWRSVKWTPPPRSIWQGSQNNILHRP